MMIGKLLSGVVLAGTVLASAAAHADPRVFFVSQKTGATVTNPVHVVFGVEGMGIAPAGDTDPTKGHHHLLIDQGPMQKGLVIPMNDKSPALRQGSDGGRHHAAARRSHTDHAVRQRCASIVRAGNEPDDQDPREVTATTPRSISKTRPGRVFCPAAPRVLA